MKQQIDLLPRPASKPAVYNPKEFKLITLRECNECEHPTISTPDEAANYWRQYVTESPTYNPDVESFVVLLLNTRRKIKGHVVISQGTLDTILVHPREVFRPAIVSASAAVILMHNHPSGDPGPSEGDIKVTRDLMRAGQLLRIEVLDHVVMGKPTADAKGFASLRELGYFCA